MHTLILGPTECGKTTAALDLCRQAKSKGFPTLVLTTKDTARWKLVADLVLSDKQKFLAVYNSPRTRGCHIFFDEGMETVGRDKELLTTATSGRHNFHSCYFIVTVYPSISNLVRENCSRIITFKQGKDRAKEIANDFSQPALVLASQLGRGEYLDATAFSIARGKI